MTKPDLTDEELQSLKKLLKIASDLEETVEDRKRRKWLVGSMRNVAIWITAVFAAISVGWEWFAKMVSGASK